jgi:regulator of RNase E activity RraA
MKFSSDEERFSIMREKMYTPLLFDILDQWINLHNQVMRADIRPLRPDYTMVGRARTMFWICTTEVPERRQAKMVETLDALNPGDVLVHNTDHSRRIGAWGGLCTATAMARGAAGVVIDAMVRDTRAIINSGFPLYSRGINPCGSVARGLVVDRDVPLMCGDVLVHPGDVIFGDNDGVIVIPKNVLDDTLNYALEKLEREDNTLREVERGDKLVDVYSRYGVL